MWFLSMDEEVLGIFAATEYGRIPVLHCNLVFTMDRVIVVKKGMAKEIAGLMAGGAVGHWLAVRSDKKQAQKLKEDSAKQMLNADKENYEMHYSDISKNEMKKLSRFSWPYSTEVNVSTEKKKRKFKLKSVKFEEAVDLFRTVLPDKVSIT